MEALWVLALTGGLRRGGTLGLRWSNIDLDGAKLHVQETRVAYGKVHVTKEPKTARSRRQIPSSPVAVEALRAHGTQQKREKLAAGPTYADHGLGIRLTRSATRSTRRPSQPRSAGWSARRAPQDHALRHETLVRHDRARGGR